MAAVTAGVAAGPTRIASASHAACAPVAEGAHVGHVDAGAPPGAAVARGHTGASVATGPTDSAVTQEAAADAAVAAIGTEPTTSARAAVTDDQPGVATVTSDHPGRSAGPAGAAVAGQQPTASAGGVGLCPSGAVANQATEGTWVDVQPKLLEELGFDLCA